MFLMYNYDISVQSLYWTFLCTVEPPHLLDVYCTNLLLCHFSTTVHFITRLYIPLHHFSTSNHFFWHKYHYTFSVQTLILLQVYNIKVCIITTSQFRHYFWTFVIYDYAIWIQTLISEFRPLLYYVRLLYHTSISFH